MSSTKSIIFERESAWSYALGTMHVVIDDITSVDLKNGQTRKVNIPISGNNCNIQVLNNIFFVKNIKKVKKIVLKFESNLGPGAARVSCVISYVDGSELNAINKSPDIDTNSTIYIAILLIFLLLFIGVPFIMFISI